MEDWVDLVDWLHPSTNPAVHGRESNSQPVDYESDALTTAPASHLLLLGSAFQFAKNNFDSIHTKKVDSNRFSSAGLHSTVEWWKVGGGERANWCLDTHFSCLRACCCSTDSTVTVKYCIQTPSCIQIEWSNFLGNRIDSSSESNRTDLNCELECTTFWHNYYTDITGRPCNAGEMASSVTTFKNLLKTHLFIQSYYTT